MNLNEQITHLARLLCVLDPSQSEAFAGYALGRWLMGDALTLTQSFDLSKGRLAEIDISEPSAFDALEQILADIGITVPA